MRNHDGSSVMRPLRYSINITLDGCCDHRAGSTDPELHRFWAEKLAQADALLFGRVTYEMMEAAWRWPAHGRRHGTLRPRHRRCKKIRRVQRPPPRRLER